MRRKWNNKELLGLKLAHKLGLVLFRNYSERYYIVYNSPELVGIWTRRNVMFDCSTIASVINKLRFMKVYINRTKSKRSISLGKLGKVIIGDRVKIDFDSKEFTIDKIIPDIRGYSRNVLISTDGEFIYPSSVSEVIRLKLYTLEYWYEDHDCADYGAVDVEAMDADEAIAKAKKKVVGSQFKILDFKDVDKIPT